LVQGVNGNFYGTTYSGGSSNTGTVFEITPGGKLTTLYSFCSQSGCTDGAYPQAALVLGSDGNFYGTPPVRGTKLPAMARSLRSARRVNWSRCTVSMTPTAKTRNRRWCRA